MKRTKLSAQTVALCGVMAAVALAILMLAGVAPTGWIGVTALAGFPVAMCVSAAGYTSGIMCWLVAGLLALLLVPGKQVGLLFLCLFGLYPVLKNRLERAHRRTARVVAKLVYFNLVFFDLYFLAYQLMFQSVADSWSYGVPLLPALLVVTNIVFFVYDYAFSKVMALLQVRLVPELRRLFKGH
jgi:hypothetical protein